MCMMRNPESLATTMVAGTRQGVQKTYLLLAGSLEGNGMGPGQFRGSAGCAGCGWELFLGNKRERRWETSQSQTQPYFRGFSNVGQ